MMWSPSDNDESDTARKFKTLLYYNQYYEDEHSIHCMRYRYSGNSWNATSSLIVYDGNSLAYLMSSTAGNGPFSYYQYPAVGVPIMAVSEKVLVKMLLWDSVILCRVPVLVLWP